MCSVNIFVCTVTVSEMELLLIVQKSRGKWHWVTVCQLSSLKRCAHLILGITSGFLYCNIGPKLLLSCLPALTACSFCLAPCLCFNKFQKILLLFWSSQISVVCIEGVRISCAVVASEERHLIKFACAALVLYSWMINFDFLFILFHAVYLCHHFVITSFHNAVLHWRPFLF